MITYIYLVTNCFENSNWVYIGKTINIKDRNYNHRVTYGEQIGYSIIDQIESLDRKDWEPLESYWIEQFRQWGFNVLNKNKGGSGPNFHTEDVKNRLKFPKPWVSKNRLGKKHTDVHKQNITKGLMGKKQSKETIEKRSQKLKGQKRNDYTKKLMSEAKQGIEITWGNSIVYHIYSNQHQLLIRNIYLQLLLIVFHQLKIQILHGLDYYISHLQNLL